MKQKSLEISSCHYLERPPPIATKTVLPEMIVKAGFSCVEQMDDNKTNTSLIRDSIVLWIFHFKSVLRLNTKCRMTSTFSTRLSVACHQNELKFRKTRELRKSVSHQKLNSVPWVPCTKAGNRMGTFQRYFQPQGLKQKAFCA